MAGIKNVTCFTYKDQAEEAARFYTSVFPDGKMGLITPWPMDSHMKAGEVLTVDFSILGRDFVALNAGEDFHFTDAISIQIWCDTQDDIDMYWEKLQAGGGKPIVCGWLKDKFGVSWQVAPSQLRKMLADPDKQRAARAMKEMMSQVKLDIAKLEAAYTA